MKLVGMNSMTCLKDKTQTFGRNKVEMNSKLLLFVIAGLIVSSYYANDIFADSIDTSEQITLSKDLQNNPLAQDILKKIELTKKMIEELKQKEYEKNQAQENLEKMRDMSIKILTQDLEEWERIWEKYSSRNVFDTFVNQRPNYVQGVFWDQFEFKERKVNEGRTAMSRVLMNGGTPYDAINAYHNAASAPRIELIEMNVQFNVKHNLADYEEQQKINADTQCEDGLVLVTRVTAGTFACIDESTAKKWADSRVPGIFVLDENITNRISEVKTNPGTVCNEGYQVIYDIAASEYQCVLESIAKEMIENSTAEIHTLTEFVLNKDKQKTTNDVIYEINKEILQITKRYDIKQKILESKYNDRLENIKSLAKQNMQDIIKKYTINQSITKEDVSKSISQIRTTSDSNQEQIIKEKLDALNKLELELKNLILEIVTGYENNSDINVDWIYLNEPDNITTDVIPLEEQSSPMKILSLSEDNLSKIHLDNIDLVNSFGQKFDEIKSEQALQVAADITNSDDYSQDFIYMVEVKNNQNIIVQPVKWMTGTLNPKQTLNVGLSWIPKETGQFRATISTGTGVNSVSQIADIEIIVNPKGHISEDNYCKNGYELLFKYADNSPICTTPNTASKLINIGLAFA